MSDINRAWPETIFQILLERASSGMQVLPDGARRIGFVPHIGRQAYLHLIPAALSVAELDELRRDLGIPIPDAFRQFLAAANGLSAFSDALGIYGRRRSVSRDNAAGSAAQPYDLKMPNTVERPKGLGRADLIVGHYGYDGSKTVLRPDGKVVRIARRDAKEIYDTWASLESWLHTEIVRIDSLFDNEGKCADREQTLPPRS